MVRLVFRLALLAAVLTAAGSASAQSTIRDPNPPDYKVEIEPKLDLAYLFATGYGGGAWGPGVRFSIPLMSPGFVKTINDSVGIGFGLDIMHYAGYTAYGYYGYCVGNPRNCPGFTVGTYDTSFWAIHLPVVMQWNFWLTEKWSVFGEPGITIRHAFFPDYSYCGGPYYNAAYGPCTPDSTTIFPTFFAGGRYKFSDKLGLTMRIGYPIDFSIGLSIFL
jgi:hypothetical protein